MIRYRSIVFLLLFCSLNSFAQTKPTIKSTTDKNRILIGEPLQFVIEAQIPANAVVRPMKFDSIPHFEFLEPPVIDTIRNDKSVTIKGVFKLTSFDSGHWVIPSYYLSASIKSDTLPVDVVFSEFDPNQDYHDIKTILQVEAKKKKQDWWWYAIGAAVVVGTAVYFLTRKKKTVQPKKDEAMGAFDEAMKDLKKLKEKKPETKEYYSSLVSIFRVYVFKRKGILSLQKTTDDLVVQLRSLQLSKEVSEGLAQSLRLGDFVKFAKYIPGPEDDQQAFNNIKKTVEAIEELNKDAVQLDKRN